MSFLFKAKQKTPAELVRSTRESVQRLQELLGPHRSLSSALGLQPVAPSASTPVTPMSAASNSSAGPPVVVSSLLAPSASMPAGILVDRKLLEKTLEEILKNLASMKTILYGDGDNEPSPELVSQLSQEVYQNDLLQLLVQNIARFEFEARKDVAQIFNNLLRRQIGSRSPTVEYLSTREDVLVTLIAGYENQEIALNCGMILRECIRHESLTKIILYTEHSQHFYRFFSFVELSTFDLASDAFATFKELLTRHKAIIAEFIEKNYDPFFEKYTELLQSNNYVTKRQSLKLLGELLLDRSNFNIMTRYISSVDNLKLMMNLLRDKSRNIQFEAFHVFKVFIANPNKTRPVLEILQKNRDKLMKFLAEFHTDRADDEQFNDEKAFLVKQIGELQQKE